MPEDYENAIEWIDGQKNVTLTLHATKLQNRVLRLSKEHPDKVRVYATPAENNGYLVAHLPAAWLKIQPPGKRAEMSDADKAAFRERMRRSKAGKE